MSATRDSQRGFRCVVAGLLAVWLLVFGAGGTPDKLSSLLSSAGAPSDILVLDTRQVADGLPAGLCPAGSPLCWTLLAGADRVAEADLRSAVRDPALAETIPHKWLAAPPEEPPRGTG